MIISKYFGQLILLPVLASPFAALSAPASYEVTFAPVAFGVSGSPALNNKGQVVGTNGREPVIWQGKTFTRITVLEGHDPRGINNRGDLVGTSRRGAFVYTSAGVSYIPVDPNWYTSDGVAINDAGHVLGVGRFLIGYGTESFLYTRRGMERIASLGGEWSEPASLNSAGHAVGAAHVGNAPLSHAHAFLYKNGQLRDLGTLGGARSGASDINDLGQIVGYSSTTAPPDAIDGNDHAFLFERGVMKDLGTLGGGHSWARALNNAGVVVGAALPADSLSVAFVYSRGKMTDLNTRVSLPGGWKLDNAVDINDKGQILAHACNFERCRWALLTPLQKSQSASEDEEASGVPADADNQD